MIQLGLELPGSKLCCATAPQPEDGTRRSGSANGVQLRPYQTAAVEAVEREFAAGKKRTLLVLPTGCGKTVVFSEVAAREVADGVRVLVLAHRAELLEQANNKLRAAGVHAEIEQGQRRASSRAPVVIASVQTLRGKRLERYARDAFGLIIVDEAHHRIAKSYGAIADHFVTARELGVTATADRADGAGLGKVYESVAYTYEIRAAIRDGFLAPIRARRILVDGLDLSAVRTHHGDFDQGELAQVFVDEKALHGVVAPLIELVQRRRTLVFAVDVAHAHALADMINRYKPASAIAIDGSAKPAEREAAISLFRAGTFQFLVNCALLTEGFDAPSIECVALVRPTQSRALYCLSADTQVLTPDGWMGPDDEFVEAYEFDTETAEVRRSPVIGRVDRPREAEERWVRFDGAQLSLSVTDGHRMVWRGREGRAHRPSPWRIATALEMAQQSDAVEIPVAGWEHAQGVGASDDEMRFLGIVMTDASIGRNGQITITQSQSSPVLREIRRVLVSVGVKFTERVIDRRGRGNNFEPTAPTVLFTMSRGRPRRTDKHLSGWGVLRVAKLVGKEWTPLFEAMSSRELRCLLDGMHIGDGCKNRRQGWKIATARIATAERLQSLCIRRGLAAIILQAAGRCVYLSVQDRQARTVPTSRADRPNLRVERGAPGERVWCITTNAGTVITRRRGRVAVLGNCQMIGRGTRLHPGKTECFVPDFVGNTRHRLVGPVDILAGGDLPDDVRAVAEEILREEPQLAMDDVLARAEAQAAASRAKLALVALVFYREREVDPFLGDHMPPMDPDSPAWREPATEKQLAALKDAGLSVPPAGFSKGEASRILDGVAARRKAGRASIKQSRLLERLGLNTDGMTSARAQQLIGAASARGPGGFRPFNFIHEPEARRGGKRS